MKLFKSMAIKERILTAERFLLWAFKDTQFVCIADSQKETMINSSTIPPLQFCNSDLDYSILQGF